MYADFILFVEDINHLLNTFKQHSILGTNKKISDVVLTEMFRLLNNEKHVGQIATLSDLSFIKDGTWLKDAAVIDIIFARNGAWDVCLIFAHHKNPLQFIICNITRCFSENKAHTTAFYMKKDAAKDRRGTLEVSIKDLNICNN